MPYKDEEKHRENSRKLYWVDPNKANDRRRKHYWENRDRELAAMKKWRNGKRDQINAAEREKHRSNPLENIFNCAKQRARRHGLEFSIKISDLTLPAVCPVLGIPLCVGNGRVGFNSPSLDRIDNRLGYVRGNVIIVSYRANTIKNDATLEELSKVVEFYAKLQP